MRLLTLASLASETSQVSFQDLTVQLDLPQERVEALIIEGSAPGFRLVLSYSGTSDKGPSEIGTASLQRTLVCTPRQYLSVLFDLRDRDDLSTKDTCFNPMLIL